MSAERGEGERRRAHRDVVLACDEGEGALEEVEEEGFGVEIERGWA